MSGPNKRRKQWFSSGGNGANRKGPQNTSVFYEGISGVLVTCNMREVECLRETYSLLQEYNDRLNPHEGQADDGEDGADGVKHSDAVDDIEAEMAAEIAELKSQEWKKFRQIPTKCKNIIFVQIRNKLDPMLMVQQLFRDIRETGAAKARFSNRFTPVQRTCKATIESVEQVVADLLSPESKDESSFMVQVKIRNNNELNRMSFVDAAAKVVKRLRPEWRVDFDEPKFTLSIDIMIKVCCVALLPDFFQLKKYNLIEYAEYIKNPNKQKTVSGKAEQAEDEGDTGKEVVPVLTETAGEKSVTE